MDAKQEEGFRQPDGSYLVDGNRIIQDVIEAFPNVAPVMRSYGLHCVGCSASKFDTIYEGCKLHRMPDRMIAELLRDVNARINGKDLLELAENALIMILAHKKDSGKGWPLRIMATETENGLSYGMDYDKERRDDTVLEQGGARIVLDPESAKLLAGMRIDHVKNGEKEGFVFVPKREDACSCPKQEGMKRN